MGDMQSLPPRFGLAVFKQYAPVGPRRIFAQEILPAAALAVLAAASVATSCDEQEAAVLDAAAAGSTAAARPRFFLELCM